jgi:hypothetical protein
MCSKIEVTMPSSRHKKAELSIHNLGLKCRVVQIHGKGGKQSEGLGYDEVIVGGGGEPTEGRHESRTNTATSTGKRTIEMTWAVA